MLVDNVIFYEPYYHISLREVARIIPHIQEKMTLDFYLIEVKDHNNKLVKRFKPFKQLSSEVGNFYWVNEWVKSIILTKDKALKLNLGKDYKIAVLLTKCNNEPLLPFEIKPVGYDAEKIVESFSDLEKNLLEIVIEDPDLNEAISFLHDSYTRLEENDIEGARTAVRNSLQILRDNFIPKITAIEESEGFQEKARKLLNDLRDFVSYGGPHPGPAPRSTTEIVVDITIHIVNYLAKSLENKMIKVKI
jgi:hypothetical protein